jgi:hypothetical protein
MARKVKPERPSRIRGHFRDGRVEMIEVQASPVGVPTVYDRSTGMFEGSGMTGYLVSYDGAGVLATTTVADVRGLATLSVRLDEDGARALRDALTVALA